MKKLFYYLIVSILLINFLGSVKSYAIEEEVDELIISNAILNKYENLIYSNNGDSENWSISKNIESKYYNEHLKVRDEVAKITENQKNC